MLGMRLLVLALALAVSGCSFMFVKPSAVEPLDVASCTDRVGWPVVDAVLGVASVTAAAYAASRSDQAHPAGSLDLDREDAIIGYGVTAAFFGASAAAGFSRVNVCREAKAAGRPLGAVSLAR